VRSTAGSSLGRARRVARIAVAAAWLLHGPAARAQAGDAALAEALFREGKALMKIGKYDEACPKLAESNRVDPGTGTLLALAFCHEEQGRTATAWAEYNEVAAAAARQRNSERGRVARGRIAELEPRLSKLAVVVSAEVASLPSLRITLDGRPLGEATWGSEVPVDPGDHVIQAEADHKKSLTRSVHLRPEADRQTVTILPLEDETAVATPHESPTPGPRESSSFPPPSPLAETPSDRAPEVRSPKAAHRPIPVPTYVAAGVGVAAIGSFAYFGLTGRAEYFNLKASCGPDCTQAEVAPTHTKLVVADVSLGVSLVALGVAAYTFFTRPHVSDTRAATNIGPLQFELRAGTRDGGASVVLAF
jgi:hypothetical protein